MKNLKLLLLPLLFTFYACLEDETSKINLTDQSHTISLSYKITDDNNGSAFNPHLDFKKDGYQITLEDKDGFIQSKSVQLTEDGRVKNFNKINGTYSLSLENKKFEAISSDYILELSEVNYQDTTAQLVLENLSYAFIDVYHGVKENDNVSVGYYNLDGEFIIKDLYNNSVEKSFNEDIGEEVISEFSKFAFININQLSSNVITVYINTYEGISYEKTFEILLNEKYLLRVPNNEEYTSNATIIIPGFSKVIKEIEIEEGYTTIDDFQLQSGLGEYQPLKKNGNLWSITIEKNNWHGYMYSLKNLASKTHFGPKNIENKKHGFLQKMSDSSQNDADDFIHIPLGATFTFNSETYEYSINIPEIETLYIASGNNTSIGLSDCGYIKMKDDGEYLTANFKVFSSDLANISLFSGTKVNGECKINAYTDYGFYENKVNKGKYNGIDIYVKGNYTLKINKATHVYSLQSDQIAQ